MSSNPDASPDPGAGASPSRDRYTTLGWLIGLLILVAVASATIAAFRHDDGRVPAEASDTPKNPH